MISDKSKELIQEFISTTKAEGVLITDVHGLRLYSTTSTLDDEDMDEVSALVSVSDSIYEKLNQKLKAGDMELILLVNDSYYLVIKHVDENYVLLSQIKRATDVNLIYSEVNKLAAALDKS